MNKRLLPLLLVLALVAAGLAWTNASVHAQGVCRDRAGNPIPCPGQEEKTPTPIPPTATFTSTPTATVTAIPTETILPLTNPTSEGDSSGGTISYENCEVGEGQLACIIAVAKKCTDKGGTASGETLNDGRYSVKCVYPVILEPTPLALINPTPASAPTGSDYTGDCDSSKPGHLTCIMDFVDTCIKKGGDSSISSTDGNITTLKCVVPLVSEPAPLPIANVDDNWIGRCTEEDKVDGSFQDCFERYTCDDGTLVMKVDLYSGDGTTYDFYCIPHKPTFPPGGWLPWITGLGGLIVGLMLLPAVQKIRNAASRTARMPNNKNPDLMKGKEDQEPTALYQRKAKRAEMDVRAQPEEPRSGVAIPNFMKNARKAKAHETPDEESMQLKAKRAEIAPQTREHVLLANKQESNGIGGVRVATGDLTGDGAREQEDDSVDAGKTLKSRGNQLPPIGAGDGI